MASEVRNLIEEHGRLGQSWLDAEQVRMAILNKLLAGYAEKCPSDYAEDFFGEYEDALHKATSAGWDYSRWLAEQGIPFR